jgi:peroxiredoxin
MHELEALQGIHDQVIGAGASLVVISPQQPARLAAMAQRRKLAFPVLWDEGCAAAAAYGLAFELPDDLRQVYRSFGIDLPTHNGDPSWRLPMPARFVIDRTGRIVSVDADPDYTVRPEPQDTLAVLLEVIGKK